MPVENLEMRFAGGILSAGYSDDTIEIPVADLKKFYFVSELTGVDFASILEDEAEVYTTTGLCLGRFSSVEEAKCSLPSGLYIVKSGTQISKIAVK